MANKNQPPAYPVKIRRKWYFLVDKTGKTVDEVCDLYFISRKTYYKWKKKDLGDRKHISPKEHPETKIKGEIRIFICNEKARINYGPLKMKLLIKRRFGIDISTTAIYKFYKKKGLIFRPQKKLAWYTPPQIITDLGWSGRESTWSNRPRILSKSQKNMEVTF